jgi:hypothetical protein
VAYRVGSGVELHDRRDDAADGDGRSSREAGADGTPTPERRRRAAARRVLRATTERPDRLALALALVPLAVSAVALVVGPGGGYLPAGDWAVQEVAVRDIGRHPVLVGLYSRGNWSHPGPLLYYLLLPFYWLTGRSSIGLDLGALAINGAALAGMALVARRRGGLPLMLATLVASTLLARTLGADFLHDPWVCFVTTLPFGLLILLSWSATCGDRAALPVAVFVASFLAQTHVGFLALAPPLVLWGAAGLVLAVWRSAGAAADGPGDGAAPAAEEGAADRAGGSADRAFRARLAGTAADLRRTGAISAAVLVVTWLPPLIDALVRSPSNAGKVWRWFVKGEEFGTGLHTLGEGWRVVTGQFRIPPEWLTRKLPPAFPVGEPQLMYEDGVPWLLGLVVLALWVLRRRHTPSEVWRLAATLSLALVLGIVAVARTVGPAFDYRLRWTWMPAAVAFAVVLWAAWLAARTRWPDAERRALVPGALVVLAVVTGTNVTTAATTGMPYEDDTVIVGDLTSQLLEVVDPDGGEVVVDAPFSVGTWWSRGVVLQLERHGVDVRIPRDQVWSLGEQRLHGEGPLQAWLVVVRDEWADTVADNPDMDLVARWSGGPAEPSGATEVVVFRDNGRDGRPTRAD